MNRELSNERAGGRVDNPHLRHPIVVERHQYPKNVANRQPQRWLHIAGRADRISPFVLLPLRAKRYLD